MKKKLTAFVLGAVSAFGLFAMEPAFAQLIGPQDNPANVANFTTWGGSVRSAIRIVVNYFLFFLGLIATVMVIYGGFLYVMSGGDDAGAEKGKKIIMYAAIGIMIILVSFALVNTLLKAGLDAEPALQ